MPSPGDSTSSDRLSSVLTKAWRLPVSGFLRYVCLPYGRRPTYSGLLRMPVPRAALPVSVFGVQAAALPSGCLLALPLRGGDTPAALSRRVMAMGNSPAA